MWECPWLSLPLSLCVSIPSFLCLWVCYYLSISASPLCYLHPSPCVSSCLFFCLLSLGFSTSKDFIHLWSTFWLCSSGVLSNGVFSSLCDFLSLLMSVYCLLWSGFAWSIILWLTRSALAVLLCICHWNPEPSPSPSVDVNHTPSTHFLLSLCIPHPSNFGLFFSLSSCHICLCLFLPSGTLYLFPSFSLLLLLSNFYLFL